MIPAARKDYILLRGEVPWNMSHWSLSKNLMASIRAVEGYLVEPIYYTVPAAKRDPLFDQWYYYDYINNNACQKYFSITLSGCFTNAREPSLLYYLPITKRRNEFIPFPGALVQSEMQTALSRIWTWLTESISCNNNCSAICASILGNSVCKQIPYESPWPFKKYIMGNFFHN